MSLIHPRLLIRLTFLIAGGLVAALALLVYLQLGHEADIRARDAAFAAYDSVASQSLAARTEAAARMLEDAKHDRNSAAAVVRVTPGHASDGVSPVPANRRCEMPTGAGAVVRVHGEAAYGGWTPLADGACLFLGERIAPYYANTHQAVGAIVGSGLVGALALLIFGWLANRQLRRELQAVAASLVSVGEGALAQRLPDNLRSAELSAIASHANEMLAKIEALVGDLRTISYTLAHDMRSYINHARLQLQMAEGGSDSDAALRHAIETLQLLDRVSVEIARLSLGKLEGRPATWVHDLAETAETAAALFGESCDDQGIALRVRAEPAPAVVNAMLVLEIVNNLLSNAIKYAGDGPAPAIELVTKRVGDMVQISVADNGPGIPADRRDAVFQLAQRLDRDREKGGQGHGLAIARLLARLNGGSIEVLETVPGAARPGARFVLRFPAYTPDSAG